jgi:hypothetical protein
MVRPSPRAPPVTTANLPGARVRVTHDDGSVTMASFRGRETGRTLEAEELLDGLARAVDRLEQGRLWRLGWRSGEGHGKAVGVGCVWQRGDRMMEEDATRRTLGKRWTARDGRRPARGPTRRRERRGRGAGVGASRRCSIALGRSFFWPGPGKRGHEGASGKCRGRCKGVCGRWGKMQLRDVERKSEMRDASGRVVQWVMGKGRERGIGSKRVRP